MMYPCRFCSSNNWKYEFDDDTRMVLAVCQRCGSSVKFKTKPRKPLDPNRKGAIAEYENRKGKRFLKIDGKFTEVGLYKFPKFLRVMPVDKNEWMRVKPNLKQRAVRVG